MVLLARYPKVNTIVSRNERRANAKCKDHQKDMKEKKEKELEELVESGILDEVDMEELIEEGATADE